MSRSLRRRHGLHAVLLLTYRDDELGGLEGLRRLSNAFYERVLAEERAKGSSDAVAQGRAKAARVKAERAQKS